MTLSRQRYCLPILATLVLLTACSGVASGQDSLAVAERGQQAFRTYCGPCHSVHREMTGPMLASVTKKRSREWLHAFIKDSQSVIVSGDPYALHLFLSYNRQVMPSFRQLPDTVMGEILKYIETESTAPSGLPSEEPTNQIAPAAVLRGKELFSYQCANCHSIRKEDYGPALGSVGKRLPVRWLIPFIQNSQKVIASGDPYANHIFQQYDEKVMVPMEFLSEDDIRLILGYIDFVSSSTHHVAGVNGRPAQYAAATVPATALPAYQDEPEQSFFKWLLIVLGCVAGVIHGYIIARLFRYLNAGGSRRL